MPMSDAKKKANVKYIKTLDELKIRVPKGMRAIYHESAKNLGYEKFNQFAIDAIDEKISRGNNANKKKGKP